MALDRAVEEFLNKNLKIPDHIFIIPDGNRRWSKINNKAFLAAHYYGLQKAIEIIKFIKIIGIKHITFFWYGQDNFFNRGSFQNKWGIRLLTFFIHKMQEYLIQTKTNIRFIGNPDLLHPKIVEKIHELERETRNDCMYHLNILFLYGGRWDILQAAKKFALESQKDPTLINSITEKDFSDFCMMAQPSPDIVLRTGDCQRLSNCSLWDLAYSELFFSKTLWPDFKKEELMDIIEQYNQRERRFGK